MILNPKVGDRVLVWRYIVDKTGPRPRLKGIDPVSRRGTIVDVDTVGVCTVRLDGGKTTARHFGVQTIERLSLLDQIVEGLDG